MRVNVTISVQIVSNINFTSVLLNTIDRRLRDRSMFTRMMDPSSAQHERLRRLIVRTHIDIILLRGSVRGTYRFADGHMEGSAYIQAE